MEPATPERYFTAAEVAERYRTTVGTVHWWNHVGRGPKSVKIGRRLLYSDVALAEYEQMLHAEADGEPAA